MSQLFPAITAGLHSGDVIGADDDPAVPLLFPAITAGLHSGMSPRRLLSGSIVPLFPAITAGLHSGPLFATVVRRYKLLFPAITAGLHSGAIAEGMDHVNASALPGDHRRAP